MRRIPLAELRKRHHHCEGVVDVVLYLAEFFEQRLQLFAGDLKRRFGHQLPLETGLRLCFARRFIPRRKWLHKL
jgi:hypothetical protein